MFYIEDDSRTLWPSVARVLASLEPLDMVLWLYQGEVGDSFEPPFDAQEIEDHLEPVAGYSEGASALHSRRVPVGEKLLTWLEPRTLDFEDWGEALSLYRPGKPDLVAAVLPHEAVILLADEYASPLEAAGFRLSDDPPDWR